MLVFLVSSDCYRILMKIVAPIATRCMLCNTGTTGTGTLEQVEQLEQPGQQKGGCGLCRDDIR